MFDNILTIDNLVVSPKEAIELNNTLNSAFCYVAKDGGWVRMDVEFLVLCNGNEWIQTHISNKQFYYAPTKASISARL